MRPEIQEKGRHGRFWCLLGLLILLIMTRYAFQIDIPRVVLLAVIGLITLLGDRDEIAAMYLCFIPMHESIDFFYALVLCTGIYLVKFHSRIQLGTQVLLIFIIIVWELLHCFLSKFSAVDLLAGIIPFVVLAVLMASDLDDLDYPFLVRAFAWATLGISLVLLVRVFYFSGFNIALALAGLQRMGSDLHSNIQDVTVAGGQINSNSLGIITVLATTGLMQLRSMKVGKKSDMVLMCVMIVLAALGTSRTYLACLALMIFLLIVAEKGGWAKKARLIAVFCLAIAVAAAAMALFFPDTFSYFLRRFSVDDISTGRDNLMTQYHRFILRDPKVMFFGIGLQDFDGRLLQFYRIAANTPHNSLQELVIAWGVPGLFLFAALFFNMYRVSSRKNQNQHLINWIPLIIILVKSIAGQLLTSSYTMLALSYAYLSLCADLTPEDEDEIRIFTRTTAFSRESGQNINNHQRKDEKR